MFRFTTAPPLAVVLVALIAVAPAHANPQNPYTLVDPGTLGGPQSALNLPAVPLTQDGSLLGTADTATADMDYPNVNPFITNRPDGSLTHAFAWRDGKLTDLGALPGNNSSAVFEMNGSGVGVGMSETAVTDPFTGWPADNAVMFKDRKVINLGTLPGGYESQATAINDQGHVSGFASNGTPDQFSLLGFGTQTRSFTWQDGVMRDIGTLGGPDAVMSVANQRGEITGQSYTNSTPNPATGIPTLDPFLWDGGHMQDLGSLGGTVGNGNWLNSRGEVVGFSDLAGDQTFHPFLWNNNRMIDLGTLGGSFGQSNSVNDAGAVVGWTTTPGDDTAHAFLWKNGGITDLTGASNAQCTVAEAVNTNDQIVGHTCDETDALLWADGKQYDLNTLVAPSPLHLVVANYINNQGEITGNGFLPDGSEHVFVLIPNREVSLPAAPAMMARASRHTRLRWGGSHRGGLPTRLLLGRNTCRSQVCRRLLMSEIRH
jgi:probable HAF family extracellular repeat protein